MKIYRTILNFILPPRCALCGKIMDADKGICDTCIQELEFLRAPICHRCGHPLGDNVNSVEHNLLCGQCMQHKHRAFRLSRSAFIYDDISKKLILDFKFHDHTDLAPLLAKMMYVAGEDIFQKGIDVIIPVPLHYLRLIWRKYNQSALLAQELEKLTGIRADNFILRKTRHTKPQVECTGLARLQNVKDAFELQNPSLIKGKRILLIDDVLTTGSTLKECTSVLKHAGVKSVDWLTIARTSV